MKKVTVIIFLLFMLSTLGYSQVFISDISDASGTGNYIYEFVELYNNDISSLDVEGYTVRQANSTQSFTFTAGTTIPAKGILVLGRDADQTSFETFWSVSFGTGVTYVNSGNNIPMINGDEVYLFENGSGINIDPATDDEYTAQAISSNNRVYRLSTGNTLSDWSMNSNSNATPGSIEGDQTLPVELTSFTANAGDSKVTLRWSTASEINNQGFTILRGDAKEGSYDEIDSYVDNSDLKGAGNSSQTIQYNWVDNTVVNGDIYWYKLVDVDVDGIRTEHGPISAAPQAVDTPDNNHVPHAFFLKNYPNPFNPDTRIAFDLSSFNEKEIAVNLTIYDMLGQKVITLYDGMLSNEFHNFIKWNGFDANGKSAPTGVYIYTFKTEHKQVSNKMLLLR